MTWYITRKLSFKNSKSEKEKAAICAKLYCQSDFFNIFWRINKQPIIFDHLLHLFIKYFSAVLQLKKRKSPRHFINPIKTRFKHKISQNKMQKRSTLKNVGFFPPSLSLFLLCYAFHIVP